VPRVSGLGEKPPLAEKSVAELKSMVANADKILAGPNTKMHAAAAEFRETARIALASRRVGFAAAAPDLDLEAAIKRIKAVANEAQTRFDLSAETAKANGVATPHKLLAAGGAPKTGGGVRSGKLKRCPYISYRAPGGIAMLQYAVPPGEAEPFWAGGLAAVGSEIAKTGFEVAMTEEEAIAAFMAALAEIAPARG
jgi:hypothetical protein